MLVDLPASTHGEDAENLGLPVHCEQHSPTANARLADSFALCERGREAGIEWIRGELHEAGADAFFHSAIKAVQNPFGFVGNNDAVAHSRRSRSYWSRGLTRPSRTSASPRSSEAIDAASRGGPSASAASRRSSSQTRASSACSSWSWSTSW